MRSITPAAARRRHPNLVNEKSWIFTISQALLGNLGVETNHPPKMCARLYRSTDEEEDKAQTGGGMAKLQNVAKRITTLIRLTGNKKGGSVHPRPATQLLTSVHFQAGETVCKTPCGSTTM